MRESINEKSSTKKKGETKSEQEKYLDKLPDTLAKKIKSIADGERRKTGDKEKKNKRYGKRQIKRFR